MKEKTVKTAYKKIIVDDVLWKWSDEKQELVVVISDDINPKN